ncbi:EAL domain-containing protein [Ralstonia insidiosa]|nr:EAL domain-containing protein [Ralstonia insidiosa]MBA9940540.1 EAL domain-containing protein [Ralstonia insidiosa]MBC9969008.1 EAL domain-containing protein [Ralstonia insidiosa]MBX3905090.1 EAL domain-containing protein [Ralstonia insidiosa]
MTGSQNYALIAVSVLVAAFTSYTALDVSARIRLSTDLAKRVSWLLGGTFAIATGLWATHILGMLAFTLPFPVGHGTWITLKSFGLALLVSYLTLDAATRANPTRQIVVLTGIVTGVGLSLMSFTAVQAVRIEPGVTYSPSVFASSIFLAIAATTSALLVRIRLGQSDSNQVMANRVAASGLIGASIGGGHYLSLLAVVVAPNSRSLVVTSASAGGEALIAVVVSSVFIVSFALVLSVLGFRHERERICLTSSLTEARQRLTMLASIDHLTSLPNREAVYRNIQEQIAGATDSGTGFHVLHVNLDSFKVFNDSYGMAIGDSLLRIVAVKLVEAAGRSAIVGRLGGDEFALVVRDADMGEVQELAGSLVESMRGGISVDNATTVRVTLSVGIASYPKDGEAAESLLKNADGAMSAAKAAGGNGYRCYGPDISENSTRRLQIMQALQDTVEKGGFKLHFQPKFGCDGQSIEGAEALIRWTHPDLGVVPPLDFIPLAERTGLISQIGNWVIGQACRHILEWDRAGLPPVRIAVNLSPQQLQQPSYIRTVNEIVGQYGVDPRRLMFEITETVAMEVAEQTTANIREFQAAGFDIAIDDFGTGYSSLAYLQRFRAKQLKIDRFFTRGLDEHGDEGYAIVSAIIGLAHTLQMQVVAEGVETQSQLQKLRDLSCDQVQGFLLGKPMGAEDFAAFVLEQASEPDLEPV